VDMTLAMLFWARAAVELLGLLLIVALLFG
jgi:hypothetical protein